MPTPRAIQPILPRPPLLRARRAFTLIEILVVVAIIVILAAVTMVVGVAVKRNAQVKNTRLELRTLDMYMKAYLNKGNPELPVTSPWPYASPTPAFAETQDAAGNHPSSDPVNWVMALLAGPDGPDIKTKFATGKDALNNVTLLDRFGTPIRYIPTNPTTKVPGYFQSAGPDGIFANAFPAPSPAPPQDDIFSTDAP